jgi:hypothetical protein
MSLVFVSAPSSIMLFKLLKVNDCFINEYGVGRLAKDTAETHPAAETKAKWIQMTREKSRLAVLNGNWRI